MVTRPIDIEDYSAEAVEDLVSRAAARVEDSDLEGLRCLEQDLLDMKLHLQSLYYETRHRVQVAYEADPDDDPEDL